MNICKKDLKSGMVVQYKNGELRMVVDEWILGLNWVNSLDKYYDDLRSKTAEDLDIVKVWKPIRRPLMDLLNEDENVELLDENLVFERVDPVEMTFDEIKEKLGIPNLKIVEKNEFRF